MTDAELPEALRRLLGPSEPELSCEACFEQLDVYVELELRGEACDAAIPGMRAHLEGCPACREEHASLRALAAEPAPMPFDDEEST
jgi:anti-sigma factor RsiW